MLKSKLKKLAPFKKRRSGGSGMGNCAGSGQASQGKGGEKKAASSSAAAAAGKRGGGVKENSPSAAADGGDPEASKSSHGELVLK